MGEGVEEEEGVIVEPEISLFEVEQNVSREKCWVIFEGYVLDITSFLNEHPGGAKILLRHAGTEISSKFKERGHSISAVELLPRFKIGILQQQQIGEQPQSSSLTMDDSSSSSSSVVEKEDSRPQQQQQQSSSRGEKGGGGGGGGEIFGKIQATSSIIPILFEKIDPFLQEFLQFSPVLVLTAIFIMVFGAYVNFVLTPDVVPDFCFSPTRAVCGRVVV